MTPQMGEEMAKS